jgi:hypothetical protein
MFMVSGLIDSYRLVNFVADHIYELILVFGYLCAGASMPILSQLPERRKWLRRRKLSVHSIKIGHRRVPLSLLPLQLWQRQRKKARYEFAQH